MSANNNKWTNCKIMLQLANGCHMECLEPEQLGLQMALDHN